MKVYILSVCLFYTFALSGQDYPRQEMDISKIADELYSIQDLDLNYEELYENLLQLYSHPLDLNNASDEDLRFFKVLSEEQIKNFLAHRKENEKLMSIYELQTIPGFDLETIYRLVPFVKVADPASAIDVGLWSRIKKESDNYFLTRYERVLQSKNGFDPGTDSAHRLMGSPDKLYLRFRSSRPGDFSFGFTTEKDPGEKIVWKPTSSRYGLDYFSFHLQLQNKGRLRNLILGDFQCQFGQGLMLGGIFGTGKGGETITTVRRSNIGLMPYTSVNEAGNLRGIAATVGLSPHLYLTGFYSDARRDANLAGDTVGGAVISSFQTSGLHRNQDELAARKIIRDRNYAFVFQYKDNQFDAGVMYNMVRFSADLLHNQTPYNQFAFDGRTNQNVGLYFNGTFQNLTFFSEFAKSLAGGAAFSAGVLWSISQRFDLSLLYRSFGRNFYSFYSNAFAENSTTQNENGIYWGWKYRLHRKFTLSGYFDLFKFPWLKYRMYAPSAGDECLLRLVYQPSRKVMMFVQARQEKKDRNTGQSIATYTTAEGRKWNYWVSIEYGLRQKLKMKTRAQFSTYQFNDRTSRGMAISQDISAEAGRFQLTARYALIDTDDYDNRQYFYENDVWLAYTMPAYSGLGVRKVILLEYKMNKFISLWLRFASTRYPREEKIGSGTEAMETNIKNDIKFQVRISF